MIIVTGASGHIGNVLIRKLIEKGEKSNPKEALPSKKQLSVFAFILKNLLIAPQKKPRFRGLFFSINGKLLFRLL